MAIGLFWATVSLCGFIALLSFDVMGFFSRKNQFDVDGRVGTNHASYDAATDCSDRQ